MPKTQEDDSDEVQIVSFVVRVWREGPYDEQQEDTWRGHITPIPDGLRHYFTQFDEIPGFMLDYLKSRK